jgi:hypothetical protein
VNKLSITNDLRLPLLSKIDDIHRLKAVGAYREVKLGIDKKIGFPLRAKGWIQLFNKIKIISASINKNSDVIALILTEEGYSKKIGRFSEVKQTISSMLEIPIKANSWKDLKLKLSLILTAFNGCDFGNKRDLFEKNKIRNFISSSKLEGIQISEDSVSRSMEEVLNKYRSR